MSTKSTSRLLQKLAKTVQPATNATSSPVGSPKVVGHESTTSRALGSGSGLLRSSKTAEEIVRPELPPAPPRPANAVTKLVERAQGGRPVLPSAPPRPANGVPVPTPVVPPSAVTKPVERAQGRPRLRVFGPARRIGIPVPTPVPTPVVPPSAGADQDATSVPSDDIRADFRRMLEERQK